MTPHIQVTHVSKYFSVYKKNLAASHSLFALFERSRELVKAVDDISFSINKGEIVGFIGPNGAGKTTTLKCLSGLLYPTQGNIRVDGSIPFERNNTFLSHISLIMGQKNQLWWDIPAIETLKLNKEIYGVSTVDFQQRVKELSELLDITDELLIPVRNLSLGQRMKLELIAALIHSPKILFLDEPTIGLDVVMQKNIRDFIKQYNERYDATIILTSHYMMDVKQLSRRVIIIDNGKIRYDGKLDQLSKKFVQEKIITVLIDKKISKSKLPRFGTIIDYSYPKLTMKVQRADLNVAISRLLNNYQISDFTVSELDIEDIIRDIFLHP